MAELINGFGHYVDVFDDAQLFTGPSLYFHFRAVEILRSSTSIKQVCDDDSFIEILYATLTAWGMHRMGSGGAKLVDFAQFRSSITQQAEKIQSLDGRHLWEMRKEDVARTAQLLWSIIESFQIGTGKTKIVVGSKTLHHLLPNLISPIDRQYTIRFFYHHTTFNRGDEVAFYEIYPYIHQIAQSCESEIRSRLGTGMNTSFTKVIDNAIVGYGLEHLK